MPPIRFRAALAAAGFLLGTLFVVPGSAQTQRDPSFVVTAISPFVTPTQPLEFAVDLANPGATPLSDVSVRLTVHNRVFSRSELGFALGGSPRGDVLVVVTEQLGSPLGAGERRSLRVRKDLAALSNSFSSGTDGVYPLTIELRIAGERIQEAFTAMPFFTEPPRTKLNLVWALLVHRPAAFDARGWYAADTIDRDVQKDGSLDVVVDAISKHPQMQLTLATTGITVDQIADMGDAGGFVRKTRNGEPEAVHRGDPAAVAAQGLLARIAGAWAPSAFQIAGATYARADPGALVHNGMLDELERQLDVGTTRVEAVTGRTPVSSLLLPADGTLDARTAVTLATKGVTTVVLAPESLPERQTRFGYDAPVDVTGGGGVVLRALVADRAIRDHLLSRESPVLNVQAALAETASSFFELPAFAGERLLVVATPTTPDAAVVRGFMNAIAGAPWLRVRTAGDAVASLKPPDERIPLPAVRVPDRAPLRAARAARQQLETLGKLFGEEDRPIERYDRYVLVSESADWIAAPQQGTILASAARGEAERTLSRVRIPGRQVTLTSRIAQIPVTIQNDTGQLVRVRVRLDSTKISFPDGDARQLEVEPGFQTVTFRAETRVTGSFPLSVKLETPDGAATIGEGTIIVRSTAVSAVTLVAVGGGVAVLLLSWVRRVARGRKNAAA